MTARIAPALGLFMLLLLAGCGQRNTSQEAPPPADASGAPSPASEKASVPPDTALSSPETFPPKAGMVTPSNSPPATAGPSAQAPSPTPPVVDPGGMIEVKATKAGLSRVGSEKCKVCHKVEFESWSATAHAKRTPPLDCESCHGAGSEYKVLSVMKDPQKARDAGLVLPARDFCATCHRSGWSDDMLARAHAHKPAAGTD